MKSMSRFLTLALLALLVTAPLGEAPATPINEGDEDSYDPAVIIKTVHGWARAWEKNVDSVDEYISFYDPSFHEDDMNRTGMDYAAWKADKQAKGKKAKCIKVQVSGIEMVQKEGLATVTFMQRYRSDSYCDYGKKTLELISLVEGYKIIGEQQPHYKKCSERCQRPAPVPKKGLVSETLGGIKPGDDLARVTARYGQPSSKKGGSFAEAVGCHQWTYVYSNDKLDVDVCTDDKGMSYVEGIRAYGGATVRTGGGIGLTSSRAQVEKTYGQGEWTSGQRMQILDEDAWVGLYFTFTGANLAEISLASLPE